MAMKLIVAQTLRLSIVGMCTVFSASCTTHPTFSDYTARLDPKTTDYHRDPSLQSSSESLIGKKLTGRVLVVVGGCGEGCGNGTINWKLMPVKNFSKVVVIVEGNNVSRQTRSMIQWCKQIEILPLPRPKMSKLNPLWPGRWYLFEDSRLTAISHGETSVDWATLGASHK